MEPREDQYDIDDELMDELGGAMDDYDGKKFMPIVQVTVSVSKGEGDEKKEPDGDEAEPTPEELEELQKALG